VELRKIDAVSEQDNETTIAELRQAEASRPARPPLASAA
jgi:hypothetical protein